ncbi:rhodanese domain protein / beta-lactamase domain protein (plasmid) [Natrialba magadii ATCC 43099]|uniref:Rhodanese domain protein / beta-lactamase domain protein n=1 Tax=Natrialba magadii (strain ATCC 43099 / DSM 3394 / CCM 3739 / CIP 104546 / IAM 13178 / JCM 8861 / NBRC 102185 / NCIMB 2190 / MS3) TaxID=547559 RepID=D3T0Y5_NATMM|nr:MBL fold metallo-hydrolase [Natrialba magadii]ADD07244.1 rhodanese domain protein / beta-lactamase domain protein [Natrialba magadii ATCC 43099]ELY34355.1 Rhodanese domain-containing protein [Natrialba magadii ATCC 43099]
MDDMDFPTPDVEIESVAPAELKARIDANEDVTLLDARMESDYDEWKIDDENVESINVPYFNFLDEELDDDILAQIPDDQEVTVLCAKGGASEFVAGSLKEHGYDVNHLEDGMNGWARIYEAVEVEDYDGAGSLLQYQRPSSGCLGYFVHDGDEAAVIDPLRAFTDRYLADADELGVDLKYAIDTHIHADHISGVRTLAEDGVEGVIPSAAVDRGVTYADDVTVADDGDEFQVGDATIETVYTPGHTSGMTSYLIDGELLATGDGLFIESVARPDLEEGDEGAEDAAKQLYESLQERVLSLPDDTLIGGAHFSDSAVPADDDTYTAPIGQLESDMAALTMDEADFVELILSDMPPRPANYEDIIATNLGQQAADDEEAFELELGPNNCAASQESLAGD